MNSIIKNKKLKIRVNFGLTKLSSNNVVRVFFVEKNFTVSDQKNISNASFYDCVPAPLAAPPMPPKVKISVFGIIAVVFCVLNGS